MITEQYVTFETARLLKEAGFEAGCSFIIYDDGRNLYRPTQQFAARWLREVQGLHVYALQTNLPLTEPQTTKWEWGYVINKTDNPNLEICHGYCDGFQSYEKALEVGLQKALKLIKKRNYE